MVTITVKTCVSQMCSGKQNRCCKQLATLIYERMCKAY